MNQLRNNSLVIMTDHHNLKQSNGARVAENAKREQTDNVVRECLKEKSLLFIWVKLKNIRGRRTFWACAA